MGIKTQLYIWTVQYMANTAWNKLLLSFKVLFILMQKKLVHVCIFLPLCIHTCTNIVLHVILAVIEETPRRRITVTSSFYEISNVSAGK